MLDEEANEPLVHAERRAMDAFGVFRYQALPCWPLPQSTLAFPSLRREQSPLASNELVGDNRFSEKRVEAEVFQRTAGTRGQGNHLMPSRRLTMRDLGLTLPAPQRP